MREFRPYGSVRAVLGNRHPYRDRHAIERLNGLGAPIFTTQGRCCFFSLDLLWVSFLC